MSLAGTVSSVVKFTARSNEFLLIRARSCGPVEGGARPVTSPPQPVARIRAAVNLRLDQIRRVLLHCPLWAPFTSLALPEIFALKCIAPQLVSTITNPYFSFPPSSNFPPFFLPMFSPSVLEDGSRSVMSARKATSHPEANLIQVRVSLKHVSVCGRCLGMFVH